MIHHLFVAASTQSLIKVHSWRLAIPTVRRRSFEKIVAFHLYRWPSSKAFIAVIAIHRPDLNRWPESTF